MNSAYKYYSTAFVIFEFHSFGLQASVADDLQVMRFVSEAWVSLSARVKSPFASLRG